MKLDTYKKKLLVFNAPSSTGEIAKKYNQLDRQLKDITREIENIELERDKLK